MNRKLVFLDIDGTFVSEMAAPSVRSADAVRRARGNGHRVFLATGRNMPIISREILDVGFDGVVASAGGHVEAEGQVLFTGILPEETIQECLSVFHDHGMYCRIETPEGIYTDPQMEELVRSARPDKTNSELIRMQKEIEEGLRVLPYEKYPGRGAYKVCFTSTSLETIERTSRTWRNSLSSWCIPLRTVPSVSTGRSFPGGSARAGAWSLCASISGLPLRTRWLSATA